MRSAAVLLLAVVVPAVCTACRDEPPPPETGTQNPEPPTPSPPEHPPAPLRVYEFQTLFARPWNSTVYVATGAEIKAAQPFPGKLLDDTLRFELDGRPGERWMMRTEPTLTQAERCVLWHVETGGVFGDDPVIQVPGAPRAAVLVAAPGNGTPDQLVVHHEASGSSASAIRDERTGLYLTIWDADTETSYRNVAPPRPWRCMEFAPGECVVAARTEGRQWVALRADLSPGSEVTLATGAAPPGGGTVICEDGHALLLLGGTLPIPAPRLAAGFPYRSTWHGVPPGEHTVRYADGHEASVTVEDGGKVKLPKR